MTPDAIEEAVAERWGLTRADVMGRRKSTRYILARHTAWLIMRRELDMSYSEIAQRSGVDHTTVLHACKSPKVSEEVISQVIAICSAPERQKRSRRETPLCAPGITTARVGSAPGVPLSPDEKVAV